MGIFGDNLRKYWESGLSCIPCENKLKKPPMADWQKWCDVIQTEEEIDRLEKHYGYLDKISVCVGKASGVVAFDFDYEMTNENKHKININEEEFEKDKKNIERIILSILPQTPAIKKGEKGWTRFYKWSEELNELSNVQANRHGIRCFDFLSWHKHCIIPPSHHSIDIKTNRLISYKWIGEGDLIHNIDDIPVIQLDLIKEIQMLVTDSFDQIDESRHGKLFRYAMSLLPFEKDKEKIAKMMVEHDKLINNPPYLPDRKHHKNEDATNNALHWLDRIKKFQTIRKKITKEKPKADKNTWDYFFESELFEIKKDVLTKKIFVKLKEGADWMPFREYESYLKSYAKSRGMNKNDVKDEMGRYIVEKEKLDLLFEIEEWDGINHIKNHCDHLHSPDFNKDEVYAIFHDFLVGVFKRLYSRGEYQNRCPIIKGNQGIGKDEWVKCLCLGITDIYYKTPIITKYIKEIIETVIKSLICHLAEFDQSGAITPAQLKSLITTPKASYRDAYGHDSTDKTMAASWITSVNVDDFFRDPTGNRRFIVVNVDKIDWNYDKTKSSQMIAQAYVSYKNNITLVTKELNEKIKPIVDDLTPESIESMVMESYRNRFKELHNSRMLTLSTSDYRTYLKSEEVEHMIFEIARLNSISAKRVRSIIKSEKCQKIITVAGKSLRVFFGSKQT